MDRVNEKRNLRETEWQNPEAMVRMAEMRSVVAPDWRIRIHNNEAFTMPAYTVVVVTDQTDPNLVYPPEVLQAHRPTNDSEYPGNCVVTLQEIPADGVGWASARWPVPIMEPHGANVMCGTQGGSFGLVDGHQGFRCVCETYGGTDYSWIAPDFYGGPQGNTGAQGRQGNQGIYPNTVIHGDGPPGPQGAPGDYYIDDTGSGFFPTGPQGLDGTQGAQGSDGAQGRQGSQGPQGWQGWQGTGADGAQGRQGWQGGLPGSGAQYKVITCINGTDTVWDYPRGHA